MADRVLRVATGAGGTFADFVAFATAAGGTVRRSVVPARAFATDAAVETDIGAGYLTPERAAEIHGRHA